MGAWASFGGVGSYFGAVGHRLWAWGVVCGRGVLLSLGLCLLSSLGLGTVVVCIVGIVCVVGVVHIVVVTADCETIEQLGSRCSSGRCLFVAYTNAKYTGSICLLRTFDKTWQQKIPLTGSGVCLR